MLSEYLSLFGHVNEALAEARRAQELDPFSSRGAAQSGSALYNARRCDEAIGEFRRALELDPKDSGSHWLLEVIYAEKGRFEEAVAEHERALALSGRSPAFLGSLGNPYARAGRKGQARALLEELNSLSKRGYVTPAAFVFLYGLGEKDRAFEWLDKAAQDQTNLMKFLLVNPLLEPLRSDPRLRELLRRVGLPT